MDLLLCMSEAYFEESWAQKMADRKDTETLDLRGLDGCRCYCDESSASVIRKAISPFNPEGRHWIDTGDYHYITLFWLEKITEPFDLLLLDNHPDDQAPAFGDGLLSCGGWVKKACGTIPLLGDVFWNTCVRPSSRPLYISIDLDVLSSDWARTDWSQGEMCPEELENMLMSAFRGRRVIGVDICGGLTTEKGAVPRDLRLNASIRGRLLEILEKLSISCS